VNKVVSVKKISFLDLAGFWW